MFAILLSDAMDPFYRVFLSFPTIVFSALIVLCVLFSLIAVMGIIDFDFLDIDFSGGADGELGGDGLTSAHVLAGIFMRLGLVGVPMPIIIFSVSLIGWMSSFTIVYYLFDYIPFAPLKFLVGLVVLVAVMYFSAYLTGKMLSPFKALFATAHQDVKKHIVGRVGIVRTSKVDQGFGEATVSDGGAGLIVKVRSFDEEGFLRGDKIVLIEYVEEENVYKVISENEFNS